MTEAEKNHSYKKETALTQPRVVIIGGGFGGLCAAIPLAFVSSWIASAFYVFAALLWLIPDPRIERKLEKREG